MNAWPPPQPAKSHATISVIDTYAVAVVMRPGDGFRINANWSSIELTAKRGQKEVTIIIDRAGIPAVIAELQRLTS